MMFLFLLLAFLKETLAGYDEQVIHQASAPIQGQLAYIYQIQGRSRNAKAIYKTLSSKNLDSSFLNILENNRKVLRMENLVQNPQDSSKLISIQKKILGMNEILTHLQRKDVTS